MPTTARALNKIMRGALPLAAHFLLWDKLIADFALWKKIPKDIGFYGMGRAVLIGLIICSFFVNTGFGNFGVYTSQLKYVESVMLRFMFSSGPTQKTEKNCGL